MNQEREMPLFTKTYDFLGWLVPLTNHFPRIHRHTVTRRLVEAALDFQEAILTANNHRGAERLDALGIARSHLDKVRLYLRLVHRWRWISDGQYHHAAEMIAEMGRLLGGWLKTTKSR
jgi:four helix bundle protein